MAYWDAIGKQGFLNQGRLNTARDCTYCLSDQLASGEIQLLPGGRCPSPSPVSSQSNSGVTAGGSATSAFIIDLFW